MTTLQKAVEAKFPCECLFGQYQWPPEDGKPEPSKFTEHANDCPAYYLPAVLALVEQERKRVLELLQWALKEGAKGFYTVEDGVQKFYHCKFLSRRSGTG